MSTPRSTAAAPGTATSPSRPRPPSRATRGPTTGTGTGSEAHAAPHPRPQDSDPDHHPKGKTITSPALTHKEARALGKQGVKDCTDALVKFGTTNGRIALHVRDTGRRQSRTVYSEADWEVCPLNERVFRNKREAQHDSVEAMIASHGS